MEAGVGGDKTSPGSTIVWGEPRFIRRRVLHALSRRHRYLYVQPQVSLHRGGWLVTCPCCSRNVNPQGGVIDIALLMRDTKSWLLFAKQHPDGRWQLKYVDEDLDAVLDMLCHDPLRVFWP
ncbi:MAG: hypothetical protein QM803_05800 [Rhodocyclaceae bacterium]